MMWKSLKITAAPTLEQRWKEKFSRSELSYSNAMVKIKMNFILGEREMQRVEVSLRFKIT